MVYREAQISDIEKMMSIRLAVKENVLSNPALVPYEDMVEYMTVRGKSWVCEIESVIVGFAMVDLIGNSVWALFIDPNYEGRGIGKKLQQLMIDWYFSHTKKTIWLETAANTKAEIFYQSTGWTEITRTDKQPSNPTFPSFIEIKFELNYSSWNRK